MRPIRMLITGVLIGVLLIPALWLGAAAQTQAQSLPFTPTPEPTDTATATVAPTDTPSATPAATPTATATPTDTLTPSATTAPLVLVATPTPLDATATPTATPLPAGYGRDRCDPNHTLQQPCALATETDITALNFNDGAVDVFSFLLKGGRDYRITAAVDAAGGIDPALEVLVAGGADTPVAANDDAQIGSPTAAVTLTVAADGWYLVRVTNKGPSDKTKGYPYTLSVRSVVPSAGAATTATPEVSDPDDLVGNAYDANHAVRLAWNVPYDLSMRCPDARPGACYAGRHTFLLVPVKQAIPLTILTYDLGEGVDTVLTLYKPDETQTQEGPGLVPHWRAIQTNDDVAPAWTLRSQLTALPDWSGLALVVVAPSDRADLALVPTVETAARAGRYRLIMGSPELPNVKAALITANTDLPPTAVPPTARPTGQAAPAAVSTAPAGGDTREVIRESCPTGQAEVGADATGLYAAAPPGSDDRIASYPEGALIGLLGQCYRGWVKVQPADSVTPGWMWGPDLRPQELGAAPTPMGEGRTSGSGPSGSRATPTPTTGIPGQPGKLGQSTSTPTPQQLDLTPLDAGAISAAPTAKPLARAIAITVCAPDADSGTRCGAVQAGVRVVLLQAGQHAVLTSGVTDASGTVTLSVSVADGTALVVRLPTLGMTMDLDANTTALTALVGTTKEGE